MTARPPAASCDVATVVAHALGRSNGRPLPPALRRTLQARFGCNLSDVRVHAGPVAAAAAESLGARAFTAGRHVVFGRREFRPRDAAGLSLLAHELAHVVQQCRATGRPRLRRRGGWPGRLGAATDLAEREAEAAAAQVIAGRRVGRLSHDDGTALRRVIRVNAAAAGIDIVAGEAVPGVALIPGANGPVAVFNLTRNFNPNPNLVGFAFDLIGHVPISLASTDTMSGHRLGFVQYIRHTFTGMFYAGRLKREGSIGMLLHPLITTDYMLDVSGNTTRPFIIEPNNNSNFDGTTATAQMGDHPVLAVKQEEQNVTTGVKNFLFHVVDVRDVWSILTLRDAANRFQHLAHVNWRLRYDIKFRWRNGSAQPISQSSFKMDPAVLGAPTDTELQPFLAALSATQTPIANDKAKAALRTVVIPPNPNRSDNSSWFNNVPPDFFR